LYPSRIPDPKTATKERGEKKFEVLKIKIWANFQRIIELFTQKIVTKLSEIWLWDPGSGIRDPGSEIRDPRSGIRKKPIPDSGSRGQKGTGIRFHNTD
jgi:hypothetical protein